MNVPISIGAIIPGSENSIVEEVINHININLSDESFTRQYKDREASFTRNRVLTIRRLVVFMMTCLQKAIQRELAHFANVISSGGESMVEVKKAAFCRARKRISANLFMWMAFAVPDKFYELTETYLWKGEYRLIGCDGSTAELPNSEEVIKKFGVFKTRDDGKKTCMGRILSFCDLGSNLILNASMESMQYSETEMLWNSLPELKLYENDILVLDRYYASYAFFFYMDAMNINYCFRMKKSWKIVKEFLATGLRSQIISIALPAKNKTELQKLGVTKSKMKVRLVKVELPNGGYEILLTSLIDEKKISVGDLKQLYGMRWNIEKSFGVLKHKVCLENFTGKSLQAIYQDFYLKIFMMNLTALAVNPINEELEEEYHEKTNKRKGIHMHQVNFTEALFTIKNAIVSLFYFRNVRDTLNTALERIRNITEPIRKGRSFKRHHLPKRKYYMNYKPI